MKKTDSDQDVKLQSQVFIRREEIRERLKSVARMILPINITLFDK